MKKKNLLAMSLMGLALVACSEDEQLNGDLTNQNGVKDGALVSMTLDIANPETKGNPNPDDPTPGSSSENTISSAVIVISYEGEATPTIVETGSDEGDATIGSDGKTISFTAPEGVATFYVYANPQSADALTSAWSSTKASAATASNYYGENAFFMSNKDGKGVTATIQKSNDNNVNVDIERAAVKVSVECPAEPDGNEEITGTLSNMKFKLGNMTNKFYLLANNSSYASAISGIDYSTMTEWKAITLDATAYDNNTIDKTDLAALTSYAYCLENLQQNYYTQNTTYIKFQTNFIPDKVLGIEAISGAEENADQYKVSDALKDSEAESPATFYVVRAGDTDLLSNYIMDSEFSGKDITLTQEGETTMYTVEGLEGVTKVEKYANGVCNFGPIWINDQADASKSPIYRNDWYHLKVTSIKLPGSSTEPDPDEDDDPETPLVSDVNITVTATALPWNLEEREIELESK